MQSQYGRYQVIQRLGQGAMSSVFLARDPFLSRLVAVKILHPDLLFQKSVLARFFKEAKKVSRIHSPNVVNIFDFGMEGEVPYLVMEFIDGQTLQKVMNQLQGEPMDPIVACAMMAQVVEGLGAASEWGIVHRDLKPETLILTQKGHLKVTDFGICHLKNHTITVTTYTSADTVSELETSKPDTPDSEGAKGPALLTIQSAPPFAEVFLDGYLFGRTPIEDKPYPAGKYRLTLKSKFGTGVDTVILLGSGIQALRFVLMDNPEPEGPN